MTLAAATGNLDLVKLLGDDGRFSVSGKDRKGNTPLMVAVMTCNLEIVECLLEWPGIEVNATNWSFQCALGLATGLKPQQFENTNSDQITGHSVEEGGDRKDIWSGLLLFHFLG
jgi:ankyrin repeat protein